METIAPNIHAVRYQQIKKIIQAVDQKNLPEAARLTEILRQQLPDDIQSPEDIQTLFFLNALTHRLNPEQNQVGNLYLMPDEGQQIKMFNFMAEKFPLVRFSQELVNTAYLAEIQSQEEIILLDIGMGSGQQMVRLLQQVITLSPFTKKMTVIGIEPSLESIATAETSISQASFAHGIKLNFMGIAKTLESLTTSDWQLLDDTISKRSGKLLINASFSLHHMNPPAFREELFARLQQYQPDLIAIIEPYADFLTTDLLERFDNAWHHYGLTFYAIDQIDAGVEEKNLVKTVFFSREIQDILAEEDQRIERFETGEMWLDRLIKAGLQPHHLPDVKSHIPGCPFVTVHQNSGHVSLNVQGHPLVSIITGRAAASAFPTFS